MNDGIRCDDARCCRDDDENDAFVVFLFDREKNDDPKQRDSCDNDKESSDGQH